MRILKSVAMLAAAVAIAGTAQAADYKAEYKVSTVLPAPFPWGIAAEKWVELVKERTDGRINLKIYSNSQLVQGDQTKEFTALRQGIIDMALGSTINWSPQVKELNLFSLPFLMPDTKALDALTGRGREGTVRRHPPEGRRAHRLGRERFPPGEQLAARDPHPGRPEGPEDPRRRLAAV